MNHCEDSDNKVSSFIDLILLDGIIEGEEVSTTDSIRYGDQTPAFG